ncbi:MAG: sulfurtransferase [Propionibacteriaceae bacterium]
MTTETPTVLIDAAELAQALESEHPPVVLDVRWTLAGPPGRPEFEAGHVPGAQWVDLEHELSGPPQGAGGRHPLPDPAVFQQAMRRVGVFSNSSVVVCDGATSLAASRLWWLLTDAGQADVRVLDGGVAAWRAAGQPVETGPARPVVEGDFEAHPGQRRALQGNDVEAELSRDQPRRLVDVRAAERYSGAVEPMDPVAGHIPGAVNLPSMTNLAGDGTFLDPAVLAARYADAGVDASSVIYCGSGITAAHTLLALRLAGIDDAYLYPGSWSDWVSDPTRPVATGEEP